MSKKKKAKIHNSTLNAARRYAYSRITDKSGGCLSNVELCRRLGFQNGRDTASERLVLFWNQNGKPEPHQKTQRIRPQQRKPAEPVASDEFLFSYPWRRLRMEALKKYGPRCMCCGATPQDGVRMNVDHIKPRAKYPKLALDINNLQILCDACNHGKGNWDETDWRAAQQSPGDSNASFT